MTTPAREQAAAVARTATGGSPVAWVTGASRGLGNALAAGLAAAGYDIAATARSADALLDVSTSVRALGRDCLGVPADVSRPEDVHQAATRILDHFGRLDACITAAGVSPVRVDAREMADEDWRSILSVNLDGTFWVLREAARVMNHCGLPGSLLAVSSVHARAAGRKLAAYSASKGAVEAMIRTLAVDWAHMGLRVNALAPGYFETDMTAGLRSVGSLRDELLGRVPLDRFGQPAELVPAAVFLLSPASSYVTGTVLMVDGGWTAT